MTFNGENPSCSHDLLPVALTQSKEKMKLLKVILKVS